MFCRGENSQQTKEEYKHHRRNSGVFEGPSPIGHIKRGTILYNNTKNAIYTNTWIHNPPYP
jgi:hypothetical protein